MYGGEAGGTLVHVRALHLHAQLLLLVAVVVGRLQGLGLLVVLLKPHPSGPRVAHHASNSRGLGPLGSQLQQALASDLGCNITTDM